MRLRELLETPVRADSLLHRMPAGWKLLLALVLILTVAASPTRTMPSAGWRLTAGVALIWVAGLIGSRIPVRTVLTRLLLLEPFVLGVAILSLFQPNGLPVFLAIFAKSSLCLAVTVLLSLTTPFPAIARALRKAGIPSLLVTTIALLYRYLFVLAEETERMRLARASRTFRSSRRRTWWLNASMIGELFVRSSERAERIHAAMCSRGWR